MAQGYDNVQKLVEWDANSTMNSYLEVHTIRRKLNLLSYTVHLSLSSFDPPLLRARTRWLHSVGHHGQVKFVPADGGGAKHTRGNPVLYSLISHMARITRWTSLPRDFLGNTRGALRA